MCGIPGVSPAHESDFIRAHDALTRCASAAFSHVASLQLLNHESEDDIRGSVPRNIPHVREPHTYSSHHLAQANASALLKYKTHIRLARRPFKAVFELEVRMTSPIFDWRRRPDGTVDMDMILKSPDATLVAQGSACCRAGKKDSDGKKRIHDDTGSKKNCCSRRRR